MGGDEQKEKKHSKRRSTKGLRLPAPRSHEPPFFGEVVDGKDLKDPPTPLSRPKRPQDPDHPPVLKGGEEELVRLKPSEMGEAADEDLMRLCQDGDEFAFEELFRRYQGPALSFIHRMVGDKSRVEALGQETFLRIFKDARSYQYPRSFSTWFYTIVRNLCKNELRWRSRHPTISIEENLKGADAQNSDGFHLADSLSAPASDPLETMVEEELKTKLGEAIQMLPEVEREVLILNRFLGLKYREIADVVGVPLGTVRSRIYSALERLRKTVKDYL